MLAVPFTRSPERGWLRGIITSTYNRLQRNRLDSHPIQIHRGLAVAKRTRPIRLRHQEEARIEAERIERQQAAEKEAQEALARKIEAVGAQKNFNADRNITPGAEEFDNESTERITHPENISRLRRHDTNFMYSLNDHGLEGLPHLLNFLPQNISRTIHETPNELGRIELQATLDATRGARFETLYHQHLERQETARRFNTGFLFRYEGTIYSLSSISVDAANFLDHEIMGGRQRVQVSERSYHIEAEALPDRFPSKRGTQT